MTRTAILTNYTTGIILTKEYRHFSAYGATCLLLHLAASIGQLQAGDRYKIAVYDGALLNEPHLERRLECEPMCIA